MNYADRVFSMNKNFDGKNLFFFFLIWKIEKWAFPIVFALRTFMRRLFGEGSLYKIGRGVGRSHELNRK